MSEKIVITQRNARKTQAKSKQPKRKNKQKKQEARTFTRGANQPIARTNRYKNRGARYKAGANGTLTVRHTEYITDILADGSTSWTLSNYFLNPGDVTVFPWLNKLATNYEKYVVDSFVVHYEPLCSTSTNGGISMLIDYDASDTTTPSKQVFFNSQNATTSPYHAESKLISTKNQLNSFFKEKSVRTVSIDPNNRREYDFGRLFIAKDPTFAPFGTILGRLFFTYVFTFKIPALQDPTEIVLPSGYPQVGYFRTTGGMTSTAVTDLVTVEGPNLISTGPENEYIKLDASVPDGATLLLSFSTADILHVQLQDQPYIRLYADIPSNIFVVGAGVKDTQAFDVFSVQFLWKVTKSMPNWQLLLVDFYIRGVSQPGYEGNFTCQLLPNGAFDKRNDIWWDMGTLTALVEVNPLVLNDYKSLRGTDELLTRIPSVLRNNNNNVNCANNNINNTMSQNDQPQTARRASLTLN